MEIVNIVSLRLFIEFYNLIYLIISDLPWSFRVKTEIKVGVFFFF